MNMSACPAVLEIVGRSMEPGLCPGQRVCVEALSPRVRCGDVVVLHSGVRQPDQPPFVVHRLVAVAHVGSRHLVFHRGDARGRVGLTDGAALAGQVLGVLGADGRLVALARPNTAARGRFLVARGRCLIYVCLRRLTTRLHLHERLPLAVRRWGQRLLG